MTGSTPGKRSLHAMTYDVARGKTVLCGGNVEGKVSDETWEWDGKQWKEINKISLREGK